MSDVTKSSAPNRGILNWIERVGNRLPDPVTMFFIGAVVVLVGSEVAAQVGWTVEHPKTGKMQTVTSLMTQDGLFWVWKTLVSNFTGFAPLGVVLVGMLGIGLAEVTEFLARDEEKFDLIMACDCLIYFGDLRQVIEPATKRLRPGGIIDVEAEPVDADRD